MPTGKPSTTRRRQRELAKDKKLLNISMSRLDGESMNVEILAGATVRELIEKTRCSSPRGEDYLDDTKVIYRLEFEGKVLRKAQRIRDVGIGDGSNVLFTIRGDDESDSDSSGPPGLISSSSSNLSTNQTHDCALSTNQTHESDNESDSEDIIDEQHNFNFKFVEGPPGCGKMTNMLTSIENHNVLMRFAIVVHCNKTIKPLASKMEHKGGRFSWKGIYFLAEEVKEGKLPSNWMAVKPKDVDRRMLRDIVEDEGVIVIGTVKKINELRRRCKNKGFMLRFDQIFYDDFGCHSPLDIFTISKVAAKPCKYHPLVDRMQTKSWFYQD